MKTVGVSIVIAALMTAAAGVGLAAVALLAAEVPLRMLFPDSWGTLASGIGQGISTLPGVSVPYRGVDEWARTALLLGGVYLALSSSIDESEDELESADDESSSCMR